MDQTRHATACRQGCSTTRRTFVIRSVAFVAAACSGVGLSSAFAQMKKSTQKVVKYQATPKGDRKCVDCTFFIAKDKTCKVVEGEIDPNGWCLRWAKKPA